jgi:16S rRNA (adenine1518-N6/adenine1519-N6)-dimethyltransferase
MAVSAKKSLGQNFLTDGNIIRRIVAAIHPEIGGNIIEIGPGQGALTEGLLEAGAHVTAIEKDDRMPEILETMSAKYDTTLNVILSDALEIDLHQLHEHPVKLVGNLPYNVGTPLLFNALTHAHNFSKMVFMLQKEVVERITAKPNTKNWGRLGVWCHLMCDCKKLFDVPPTAFYPKPKITSAIVELTPLPQPRFKVDTHKLDRLLRASFGQRRKMLRASLKGLLTEAQIEAIGISPQARPETLSLEELCSLSNLL